MFVSGLRRKVLLYVNNGPRERFLRIQFPKKGVFVSPTACNITSRWLKTIDIYSFPVLEARSMKSGCWQGQAPSRGPRRNPSWPLWASVGAGRPMACGCIPPVSALPRPPPHPTRLLPSVSSLLTRTLVIGLRLTWITEDNLIWTSFLTPVKTLFLKTHMFWMDFSLGEDEGGMIHPHLRGFHTTVVAASYYTSGTFVESRLCYKRST